MVTKSRTLADYHLEAKYVRKGYQNKHVPKMVTLFGTKNKNQFKAKLLRAKRKQRQQKFSKLYSMPQTHKFITTHSHYKKYVHRSSQQRAVKAKQINSETRAQSGAERAHYRTMMRSRLARDWERLIFDLAFSFHDQLIRAPAGELPQCSR